MGESPGEYIAIGAVMLCLSTTAAILRFCARSKSNAATGADDYFIILAQIFVIGMCISMIIAASVGNLGQHSTFAPDGWPVPDARYVALNKCAYLIQVFEKIANGSVKIATLLFFRRIFSINATFQKANNVALVIIAAWTVSFFMSSALVCLPTSAYWAPRGEHDLKCFDEVHYYAGFAVSDLITDIAIVSFPIPLAWKLQMPLKRKFSLLGLFALGYVVVAISAVRLYEYYHTKIDTVRDISYTVAPALTWSVVESSLAVLASCLPTYRPLFRTVMDSPPATALSSAMRRLSLFRSRTHSVVDPLYESGHRDSVLDDALPLHKTYSPKSPQAWTKTTFIYNGDDRPG